jgi:hypothetical protein
MTGIVGKFGSPGEMPRSWSWMLLALVRTPVFLEKLTSASFTKPAEKAEVSFKEARWFRKLASWAEPGVHATKKQVLKGAACGARE